MDEAVNCPACSRGLRGIPKGRRLLVTCSVGSGGCGTRFYHPPVERSTIAFRCSKEGRAFSINFRRDPGKEKFVVDGVKLSTGSASPASGSTAYAADIYDLTHFYCPCCGYSPVTGSDEIMFIRCGKCQQLTCGGMTYDTPEGRLFHCYPECGNRGLVKGIITEFEATRSTGAHRLAVPGLPKPDTPTPKAIGKG